MLSIAKSLSKIKIKYISGKIILLNFYLIVRTKDKDYILNTESNRLISGKGYIKQNDNWIKFIGLKGVTYTSKSIFIHKPGDIVEGIIKNNEFYIR
jgi:hypothetical protein